MENARVRADGERLFRQCERVRRMTDRRGRIDRTRAERGLRKSRYRLYTKIFWREASNKFLSAQIFQNPRERGSHAGDPRRSSGQAFPETGTKRSSKKKIPRKREKEVRDGVRSGNQSE